jgi:hypothetical protein
LPVANQSLTENLLASGALQWPQPYPTVNRPDNSGVDDLWHAATNGRGRFVNAQSADELKLGMGQILQDITNQAGSHAGGGLASSSISLSNHAVYRVTFQPGWAGTVTKIDIDPVTGAELSNIWEAAAQLHNQLTILPPPDDKPWFTKRRIFTTDDSNATSAFRGSLIGATGLPYARRPARQWSVPARQPTNVGPASVRVRNGPLDDIVDTKPFSSGLNAPPRRNDPLLDVPDNKTSGPRVRAAPTRNATRVDDATGTRPGRTRTTCIAPTTPGWARSRIRTARYRRSAITTTSTRRRGSTTSTSAAAAPTGIRCWSEASARAVSRTTRST